MIANDTDVDTPTLTSRSCELDRGRPTAPRSCSPTADDPLHADANLNDDKVDADGSPSTYRRPTATLDYQHGDAHDHGRRRERRPGRGRRRRQHRRGHRGRHRRDRPTTPTWTTTTLTRGRRGLVVADQRHRDPARRRPDDPLHPDANLNDDTVDGDGLPSPTRSPTATADSNTATVTITVAAVNDAPVAVDDANTHQRGHRGRTEACSPTTPTSTSTTLPSVVRVERGHQRDRDPARRRHATTGSPRRQRSSDDTVDADGFTFTYKASDGDARLQPGHVTITIAARERRPGRGRRRRTPRTRTPAVAAPACSPTTPTPTSTTLSVFEVNGDRRTSGPRSRSCSGRRSR